MADFDPEKYAADAGTEVAPTPAFDPEAYASEPTAPTGRAVLKGAHLTPVPPAAPDEALETDQMGTAPMPPPQDAALAAFKAKTSGLSPDQGTAALDHAAQTGLGPIYVAKNLDAVQQAADHANLKAALSVAPVTASYAAQTPAHAAAVKDDADNLSFLEWMFGKYERVPITQQPAPFATAGIDYPLPTTQAGEMLVPPMWESHWAKGMLALRASLLGIKRDVGGLTAQDQANLSQAEESAATEVPGEEGHIVRKAVGTSVEALPQMAGFLISAPAFLLAQTYGSLRNHFAEAKKDDGTPKYTDNQARALALGGAAATTAILGGAAQRLAGGTVGRLLPATARNAMSSTATDALLDLMAKSPELAANLTAHAVRFGQHALNGLLFMMGLSTIENLTDQTGEVLTGGRFDPSKAVQAAQHGAEASLLLLPLMAIGPVAGIFHDVGRAWKAHADGLDIASQIEAAKASKLIKRSPEQARTLLDAQSNGTGHETAYIPVAAFDAAMAQAQLDPAEVAADLTGDPDAHREAHASGGDLAVPMPALLTKLAPEGHADALLPDIKRDADGMTLREAQPLSMLLAQREVLKQQLESPERTAALADNYRAMATAAMEAPIREHGGPGSGTPEKPTDDAIYRDFFAKVAGAPGASEAARLYAAAINRLAERTGFAPEEVARRFPMNLGTGGEGVNLQQRGEIRAILAGLPEGATLADLRAALEAGAAENAGVPQIGSVRELIENLPADATIDDVRQSIEGTALHQGPAVGPLWHSALENAALAAKQAKGTPESWLAVLSKSPGVKAEEIEETGVKEWLAQQKGTVSREDVAQYIREHRVELQERVLGGSDARYEQAVRDGFVRADRPGSLWLIDGAPAASEGEEVAAHALNAERSVAGMRGLDEKATVERTVAHFDEIVRIREAQLRQFQQALTEHAAIQNNSQVWAANHRLYEHDVKDKQEAVDEATGALAAVKRWQAQGVAPKIEEVKRGAEPHYESYTTGVHKPGSYREILLTSPAAADYSAPHFGDDGQGVIAHARIGETTDAQGRKVMMVEEIQSDLHQEGRHRAYGDKSVIEEAKVALHDRTEELRQLESRAVGRATTDMEREEEAVARRRVVDADRYLALVRYNRLPDVPWRDTWEELMVRRLIRYAAEHGFERIALTPGAVHTGRYGTEEIAWEKLKGPTRRPVKDSAFGTHQWRLEPPTGERFESSAEAEAAAAADTSVGWRVAATTQRGGEAAGIDIEAEARRRDLLSDYTQTIQSKLELHAILDKIGKGNLVDKVWDRMQKEDSGISRPRAEGFEQAYDKRLKGAFDKILKKYGGKMETEAVAKESIKITSPEGRAAAEAAAAKATADWRAAHHAVLNAEDMSRSAIDARREEMLRLHDVMTDAERKAMALRDESTPAHVADLPPALAQKVLAEGMPLFQRPVEGTPLRIGQGQERGSIVIGPATGDGRNFTIHLGPGADESTLAHEVFHGLSVMTADLAKEKTAAPDLVADHEAMAKGMGYASGAERQAALDPAKEEVGAQAFEQYLFEGKAPSPELAGVFARFKEWLTRIYRTVRSSLNDEMRGVFDRMFAPPGEQPVAKRPQPPQLAAAAARAKEARDFDTALDAYAADRIAKLKIADLKPYVYEQQARVLGARMMVLAKDLGAARTELTQTKVITPQNHAGEPATYKLVEAKDLIASHTAGTFSPNPAYPAGVQERDYLGSEHEQNKVTVEAGRLNPALLLADSPTAVDGPPLVTSGPKALVLGGNGRSMMLRRAYEDGPAGEKYREALRAKATHFGIAPEAVDAMKQPVLVRSIDAIPDTAEQQAMAGAVRRFNEGLTQQLSPRLRAVGEARVLTPQTIASIGELLGNGDTSLRELLREKPQDFLRILERDGVVNNENRPTFVRGGELTDEGKDRIEGMFLGRVMGSGERLEATPPSISAKVERIAAALLRVAGQEPNQDEIGDVQGALDLINEAARRGVKLDDLLDQRTAFVEGRVEPRTIAMARLLSEKTGKDLAARFKAWADAAAPEKQGGLFSAAMGGEDPLAALFRGQEDDLSGPSRPAGANAPKAPETAPEKAPGAALNEQTAKKATKAKAAEATLSEVQGQHLVADHLARAAAEAKAEAVKVKADLGGLAKDDTRSTIARANPDYLAGYDAIAEAATLRPRSGAPLNIEPMLQRMDAMTMNADFDIDAIRDLMQQPPRRLNDLTLEQAQNVRDALVNLKSAARDALEAELNGKRAEVRAKVAKVVDYNGGIPDKMLPTAGNAPKRRGESIGKTLIGLRAELTHDELLIKKVLGPEIGEEVWREYMASKEREETLNETVAKPLQEARDAMPKALRKSALDGVDGPPTTKVDPGRWVRQDLRTLAALVGTETGMQRVAGGLGVSEASIHTALGQLEKAEWDYQQRVGAVHGEVLWPKIAAYEASLTGLAPRPLELKPITTRHGTYPGWYAHMAYNREATLRAVADASTPTTPAERAESARLENAAKSAAISEPQAVASIADYWGDIRRGVASVSKGFLKTRVQRFFGVPDFSADVQGANIAAQIRYLAFDPYVRNFGKLLRDPELRGTVAKKWGLDVLQQLDSHLMTAARGSAEPVTSAAHRWTGLVGGGFVRRVASGTFQMNPRVMLSLLSHVPGGLIKLRVATEAPVSAIGGIAKAGVGVAAGAVPDWALRIMPEAVGEAIKPWQWRAAREESFDVRERWDHLPEKMRELLLHQASGQRGPVGHAWDAMSWMGYRFFDQLSTQVFYHAGKMRALREKATPEEAIRAGGDLVRLAMPPLNAAERGSFARDRGLLGSLWLARNFKSTAYNWTEWNAWQAQAGLNQDASGWQKVADRVGPYGKAAAYVVFGNLALYGIGHYMLGHGKRDDETWGQYMARRALASVAGDVPIVDEVAESLADAAVDHHPFSQSIRRHGLRAATSIAFLGRSLDDVGVLLDHNKPLGDRLAKTAELLMWMGGGPAALVPTLKYGYDVARGREHPRNAFELGSGLLYGKHPHQDSNFLLDTPRAIPALR